MRSCSVHLQPLWTGHRCYLSVDTQQEQSQAFDWSRQEGLLTLTSELLQHRPPRAQSPLCKALHTKVDHQLLQHPH